MTSCPETFRSEARRGKPGPQTAQWFARADLFPNLRVFVVGSDPAGWRTWACWPAGSHT